MDNIVLDVVVKYIIYTCTLFPPPQKNKFVLFTFGEIC